MNINHDPEAVIGTWLEDGPAQLPSETRQAIVVGVRTQPRRRTRFNWPTFNMRKLAVTAGALAVLAVVGAIVVSSLRQQAFTPAAPLPTTAADWTPVVIDPN